MTTDLNVGSKIRVVNKNSKYYRYRGVISEIMYQTAIDVYTGETYNDPYAFVCSLHTDAEKCKVTLSIPDVVSIQKKFIDIEHIKEGDVDLGNGIVRKANTYAFEVGDVIQITEKIDGANASISYNEDDDVLEVFSRTNLLNNIDGLRGFKAYIDSKFKKEDFKQFPNYVIFGEWCVSHKCQYEKSWYNVWRVYDIWDKDKKNYLQQDVVKKFCIEHNIEYIHELYNGPFISWEHCRSFMDKKTYGGIEQEGIVVKNQTKLERVDVRFPKYLKIVNDAFKESMLHKSKQKKEIDPEQAKVEAEVREKIASVVTEARVKKMIFKCVDDGIVPESLELKCIGTLMKNIPKMVFNDLLKEEPEVISSVGALAGKFCGTIVAQHVKSIVLGK